VAKFDKMIKEGKIKPLGILSKEASKTVSTVKAEAVETQPADDTEDYSAYLNVSSFERDAMSKL
jgi:predicted DNA-binding protein